MIKLVGKLREAGLNVHVGHIHNIGICVAYMAETQMDAKELESTFIKELNNTSDYVTYSDEYFL